MALLEVLVTDVKTGWAIYADGEIVEGSPSLYEILLELREAGYELQPEYERYIREVEDSDGAVL